MDRPLNVVLLLAGGHGYRMHSTCPKQFMEIAGEPVISYTMQTFERHPETDRIYVVCNPEWFGFVEEAARKAGIRKFRKSFAAGQSSIDSLRNGIEGLSAESDMENPTVLTHEAVRPLISDDIITLNLRTFRTYGNAVTAVKSHEAYMISRDGISSAGSIPREALHRAQTPLTFCLNELKEILRKADETNNRQSQSLYTLITEVFPEKKLYISPGSERNFKLTLPEDVETLQALLACRKKD